MKNTLSRFSIGLFLCLGMLINSSIAQDDEVLKVVDEMPRFPGCEMLKANAEVINKCAQEKMLEFIYKNLEYPAEARKNGVEGMAVIQFNIGKKGQVLDIEIVRDPGAGTGNAAKDVVEKMNTMEERWIPGKMKGAPVKVQYTLPIKFKLENGNGSKNKGKGKNDKAQASTEKVMKNDKHARVSPFGKVKKTQVNPRQLEDPNSEIPPPPPPAPSTHQEEIFKVVEEMPRFPGCEDIDGDTKAKNDCSKNKMMQHIYSTLVYPEDAKKNNQTGTAVVQFAIDTDGSLTNKKIVRDPGYGMGQAALDVVNTMDKWIPGKQRGRMVKVLYTLPVRFETNADGTLNRDKAKSEVSNKKKKSPFFKKRKSKVSPKQLEDTNSKVPPPPPPPPAPPIEEEELFKVVEQMPRFAGCEDMDADQKFKQECARKKMLTFILDELVYPEEAYKSKKEGQAIVQFVVRPNGNITNAVVLRDPGNGMGQAALDVVNKMPKWIPGKQRGKTVAVKYTLPIKFRM